VDVKRLVILQPFGDGNVGDEVLRAQKSSSQLFESLCLAELQKPSKSHECRFDFHCPHALSRSLWLFTVKITGTKGDDEIDSKDLNAWVLEDVKSSRLTSLRAGFSMFPFCAARSLTPGTKPSSLVIINQIG
jgi:hypothetical protein